ncbi:hypothetical protein [Cellulomonas sp. P5_C6]
MSEELVKDRRAAYATVMAAADAICADPRADTREFEKAVVAGDFLSSAQMYRSGRLLTLLDHIGTDEWRGELDWFRELARLESQQNSATRRWLHRRRYVELSRVQLRDQGHRSD